MPSSILRIVCYFIKICEYKRKAFRRNTCDKTSSLLLESSYMHKSSKERTK